MIDRGITTLYQAPEPNPYGFQVNPSWATSRGKEPGANGKSATAPIPYDRERDRPNVEKIKSGPIGNLPWFLPWMDPQQSVDETPTMRLAYRKMLNDASVNSGLQNNVLGVMAQDLQVHPTNKKNLRDGLLADFCQWNLNERQEGGAPRMVWEILAHAVIDGCSVCEPVMELETMGLWRGKMVLDAVKAKDINNDIVPLVDEFRNITGYRALRYNGGEDYARQDFLHYAHLPLFGNPGGRSAFRAIYSDYWMLDSCRKLRAHGGEKRAFPVIVGEYPSGSDKQQSVEQALAEIRHRNWLAVPDVVKVQVIDIAGSGGEYFETWQKDLERRIAIGLQGAFLQALTGGQGEERGNSKVHESTSNTWQWQLQHAVVHLINHHKYGLIRKLIDPNFQNVTTLPRASMGGVDDREHAVSVQVDKALVELGLPLSKEDRAEHYGRKLADPANPDDALQAQPKAPPGFGPPGSGGPPGASPPGSGQPPVPEKEPDEQPEPVKPQAFSEGPHKFSTTHFDLADLPGPDPALDGRHLWQAICELANRIADEDLAEDGRELAPHITVLYGLHTDDADKVRQVVKNFGPVKARLGPITFFPAPAGKDYDVVKLNVEGEDLYDLRQKMTDRLEYTDKFPGYQPHVTLAYVKKGLGQKYAGPSGLEGHSLNLGKLVFSNRNCEKTALPLTEAPQEARNVAEAFAETWNAREAAGATIPEIELDIADRQLRGTGWILDPTAGLGQWIVRRASDAA